MKVLCVEGTWVVRTKGEIDPQVTYSGCRSLTEGYGTIDNTRLYLPTSLARHSRHNCLYLTPHMLLPHIRICKTICKAIRTREVLFIWRCFYHVRWWHCYRFFSPQLSESGFSRADKLDSKVKVD